eukprot:gene6999-9564_t
MEQQDSSDRQEFSWFSDILGTSVLQGLSTDAILLIAAKSLRLYSFGILAVILAIYLTNLGFPSSKIGLMFSLTLVGDAIMTIYLSAHSDRFGRKNTLIIGAVLSIITSITFASQTNFWILLISAIIGVISPSGNEIGVFMAIELSSLAEVTNSSIRTKLMAWYNLFGCFSTAAGSLSAGFIIDTLVKENGFTYLESCKYVMMIYAALQVVLALLFTNLSNHIESSVYHSSVSDFKSQQSLNTGFLGLKKSKWLVLKLCVLFMMDSFGGSFILQSLVSNWFYTEYKTPISRIGMMVFVCSIVAGISALFAAKLADRIGLILTMVVTHLPSNVLIILVPLMPNETLAIVMLCLRYSISQMDVPTRNAYVQSVVSSDERSAANGVTNVARTIGACVGPYLAGLLYVNESYRSYPFYVAGTVKIIYDLLLLWSFSSIKPDFEIEREEKNNKTNITSELTPLRKV